MGKKVLIAGGGLAGLAAAVRLIEHGHAVTVLEQRKRLGGRAYSFADPQTGDATDNGQHLFISAYTATWKFLQTIGTAEKIRYQEKLEVPYRDPKYGGTVWLKCPNLPAPLHLLVGALRLKNLTWADKWALLKGGSALLGLRRNVPAELDEITVAEFLDRMGATPALRRNVWDPIIVATLNEVPEKASAYLLGQVLREGFLTTRKNSMLGYATRGLSELYVDPAARWIEAHGGVIEPGVAVTSLVVDEATGTLRGFQTAEGVRTADAYVLAVPPGKLAKLVEGTALAGNPFFEGPSKITDAPIVSVNLWLEKPLALEAPFVGLLDRPVQWVFDRGAILGEGEPGRHPYALVTSAAHELAALSNAQILEAAVEAVRETFPEARETKVVHASVVKEPHATFSASPGFERLRRPQATPVENLFLAGDWTDTRLPATIESAVRSAEAAASAVDAAPARRL